MWMDTCRGRFLHCSSSCQPLWVTLGLNEPENKTLCVVVVCVGRVRMCVRIQMGPVQYLSAGSRALKKCCSSVKKTWYLYVCSAENVKQASSLLTETQFNLRKNPSRTARLCRGNAGAAVHVMQYVCPAREMVWMISWHRRDAYLGCMQCHKCHVWLIECCTASVRGHCSP